MSKKPGVWAGRCKCSGCFYTWTGVVPLRSVHESFPSQPLQCPECRRMTGLADPEPDDEEEDDQDTIDQD